MKYFAMNRHTNGAAIIPGIVCWEQLQGMFRCGIRLQDGTSATGIGRYRSKAEFERRAKHSNTEVLP